MKNRIAHIISKSISHNIKLLSEGYFDDMFDDTDTHDNDFLSDIHQDQEISTNELILKSLRDLSSVHIMPLFLTLLSDRLKDKVNTYLPKLFPKEKYNTETNRYELVITAKTISSVMKMCSILTSLITEENKWTEFYNQTAPLYMNNCLQDRSPRTNYTSGPPVNNMSICAMDFNKNTTKQDIYNYIEENDELYHYISNKEKSIYVDWLTVYKNRDSTDNEFFNKLIDKSNSYETCYISPNKGIAITTLVKYVDLDDNIYTFSEMNNSKNTLFVKQQFKDGPELYRKIWFIYTIQFTNDYNFHKEITQLQD